VSSSVATVIPDTGFAEEPICPVMRLDTVTNRKAKSTARMPPTMLIPICGSTTIATRQASTPSSGRLETR